MTVKEKRQMVREMTTKLNALMLAKLPDTPDDWDGIQLRRWMVDCARQWQVPMNRVAEKEYLNDLVVHNLD